MTVSFEAKMADDSPLREKGRLPVHALGAKLSLPGKRGRFCRSSSSRGAAILTHMLPHKQKSRPGKAAAPNIFQMSASLHRTKVPRASSQALRRINRTHSRLAIIGFCEAKNPTLGYSAANCGRRRTRRPSIATTAAHC